MANPGITNYIANRASAFNLDPNAVLSVAAQEGLGGGIGDNGTSFGPWQLHQGGALPGNIPLNQAQSWSWSPQGIDYALGQMSKVAAGQRGPQAVNSIVSGFERPANPQREIANALASYGGQSAAVGNPYVNPLAGMKINRLDQGIDFQGQPGSYVGAIGPGVVNAVKADPGGFGRAIYYTLTAGPYAGRQIYLGHAQPTVKPGERLSAGQAIAQLLQHPLGNATQPGWGEMGFAQGGVPMSQSVANTQAAQQFQRFLSGLGGTSRSTAVGPGSAAASPFPAADPSTSDDPFMMAMMLSGLNDTSGQQGVSSDPTAMFSSGVTPDMAMNDPITAEYQMALLNQLNGG